VYRAWKVVGTPLALKNVNWMGTVRKDREKKFGIHDSKITSIMLGKVFYLNHPLKQFINNLIYVIISR